MVRIGVIGAGAAGLLCARACLERGHQVQIWEQCDRIGGTWVYCSDTGVHSSMYEEMKTNLPKEMMAYPNRPFDPDLPSFLDREHVEKYLNSFAHDLPVELSTKVVAVERIDDLWQVKLVNKSGVERSAVVDALFVCNGHYSQPWRPLDERLFKKGSIIHSHDYRNNHGYDGCDVVVLGHGYSGPEIACQVAEVAEKVYLVGHVPNPCRGFPENVILVCEDPLEITEYGIRTETREIHCDHIILATGYLYSYPFLEKSLISVEGEGKVVRPLYMHFIHRHYPQSLYLIGINFLVIPFILFHAQAQYALALIEDRVEIPGEEEMIKWEVERLRSLAIGGESILRFHMLGKDQWEYYDELARKAQSPQSFYTRLIRKLGDFTITSRNEDIIKYKLNNFRIIGADDFEVIDEKGENKE